ncbi:MAG: nucleotide exchange factor GrpE [Terriglobia bacterium]
MSEKGTKKKTGTGQKQKEPGYKKKYEKVRQELDEKEGREAELVDCLKRLQAEFENYKKRMDREKAQTVSFASEGLIIKLLPVIDNLERALGSGENNSGADGILEGLELVYDQLKNVLRKEGVEQLSPEGMKFDPQLHEAVLQVETAGEKDETVLEVLQRGYVLNGRVLRPAMVKVAKA